MSELFQSSSKPVSKPTSQLSLLYRGSLSSCNYSCGYCPFAKTTMNKAEIAKDASELNRFTTWLSQQTQHQTSLLFTPWGEGLVHAHYRDAMSELSHLPHIRRVAIQTNLSTRLDWLGTVNKDSLALWCTFHPSQISLEKFVAKCGMLADLGIRFSVGMVALKEDFALIALLNQQLHKLNQQFKNQLLQPVSLWLNAYDMRTADYYSDDDVAWLTRIDPHFIENLNPKSSLGKACDTGKDVFSINDKGDVSRCHFLTDRVLANIYDGSFAHYLQDTQNQHAKPCSKKSCDCFIGYVHRPDTHVYDAYKGGRLERVAHIT